MTLVLGHGKDIPGVPFGDKPYLIVVNGLNAHKRKEEKKNALGPQITKGFCNMVIVKCRQLCSRLSKLLQSSKGLTCGHALQSQEVLLRLKVRQCCGEEHVCHRFFRTSQPCSFKSLINCLIGPLTFKHLHFISLAFFFTPFTYLSVESVQCVFL